MKLVSFKLLHVLVHNLITFVCDKG